MDFTFSDEQAMVAATVRALLVERCTGADLRQLMGSGAPRDAARWAALCDMALTGAMVPEANGGLGLAETDFVQIAEATGYVALPEPLVDHAGIIAPLLAGFAGDARAAQWLPRVVSGEAAVALAHPANPFVADADSADILLLVDGDTLHLVERSAVVLTRRNSIDPFRRIFAVDWAPSAATSIGSAPKALPLAFERGALFAAAQGLGLAQRSIDLAAAYARERVQFGKPIGSTQAVKHLLATAQVAVEFARPVVHAAAAQIGQDDAYARARTSHAKLVALGAAEAAARTAIQVHGAMGYSWEVDVHFYLKRALALAGLWGDEAFHRRRFMARLALPLGPDTLFARDAA